MANTYTLSKISTLILTTVFFTSCNQGYDPDAKKKYVEKVKNPEYWIYKYSEKKESLQVKGMVYIPEGEFIMGSNEIYTIPSNIKDKLSYADQQPEHTAYLDGYYIDRFEVTKGQVWDFDYRYDLKKTNGEFPAIFITWEQANLYCSTRGKKLPTEEEWEKAARGNNGNIYPWGNVYKDGYANVGKKGAKRIVPVGSYKKDVSIFGIYDLAGNAAEWTRSWYRAYPGNSANNTNFGKKYRIIRGNSWKYDGNTSLSLYYTMSSYRFPADPEVESEGIAFRCAMSGEKIDYNIQDTMIKIDYWNDKKQHHQYYIDRYEVTNSEYAQLNPMKLYEKNESDFPVVDISWFSADRYCRWLGKKLPTESEWENAAMGKEKNRYPWGDEFDKHIVSVEQSAKEKLLYRRGSFVKDKTETGIYNMGSNAKEWVQEKMVKGGGPLNKKWTRQEMKHMYEIKMRSSLEPSQTAKDIGFRCAADVE